jgi:hypothetical protein
MSAAYSDDAVCDPGEACPAEVSCLSWCDASFDTLCRHACWCSLMKSADAGGGSACRRAAELVEFGCWWPAPQSRLPCWQHGLANRDQSVVSFARQVRTYLSISLADRAAVRADLASVSKMPCMALTLAAHLLTSTCPPMLSRHVMAESVRHGRLSSVRDGLSADGRLLGGSPATSPTTPW